ncbi:hypothetical protein MKW98_016392, partial [Papaver atlanticum]
MANPNYVYHSDTAIRHGQIPFHTVGSTSQGGGEQQHNFDNGGPHYQCDYFSGQPFP